MVRLASFALVGIWSRNEAADYWWNEIRWPAPGRRCTRARGHEVTLFNRDTQPSALPEVETIHGDRNKDLDKLQGRRWDTVVDTCGQLPRNVKATAETLSASVERYVFISSQSAYADVSEPGVEETAPLKSLTGGQLERVYRIDTSDQPSYAELYGGLKAHCVQDAGLRIRPLRKTVSDTLTWAREELSGVPLKAGIDPARQATLLARWHETH